MSDLYTWFRNVLIADGTALFRTEEQRTDVAAKLLVLGLHAPCHESEDEKDLLNCEDGHYSYLACDVRIPPARCTVCVESWGDELGELAPCRTVRILAQAYANRPGFLDEWRDGS